MSLKARIIPTMNIPPATSVIPEESEGGSIPKIIHQTFRTKRLRQDLADNVAHIQSMNPGWEYRLYDDGDIEKFIEANYPASVLASFNRINRRYGAARADLFRYLLIYKIGGVYLDIKSTTTRPLDSVLRANDRFLISQWRDDDREERHGWGDHHDLSDVPGGEFQQWFLAAAPGHPFLKAVIETVLRNIDVYLPGLHGTGHYGVVRLTGPVAFTRAIAPLLDHHPHRRAGSRTELGLRYTIYDDEVQHRSLTGAHYSEVTEPIVPVGPARAAAGRAYGRIKTVWASLKSGARSIA